MAPRTRRALRHAAWVLPLLAMIAAVAWFAWPGQATSPGRERRARTVRQADAAPARTEHPPSDVPVQHRAIRAEVRRDSPRVNVEVHVVDAYGEPVPDALVEARALARWYKKQSSDDSDGDDWGADGSGEDDGDDWGADGSGDDDGDDWDADGSGDDDNDDWGEDAADDEPYVEERRETMETARADRNGIAILSVLSDEWVAIHAQDDAGRAGTSELERFGRRSPHGTQHGKEPQRVRVEIAAASTLHGRVTNERGIPVAGASVYVYALTNVELDDGADTPGTSATTDAQGRYRIRVHASGAFDFEVEADGFQSASADSVPVLAGRETARDFVLDRAEEIAGVVLDARGKPVMHVPLVAVLHVPESVRRKDVSYGVNRFEQDFENGFAGDNHTYTDGNGRFRFGKLKDGNYILAVEPEKQRPAEAFDVQAGQKDLTLRLADGGRVMGSVRVPDPGHLKHADSPSMDVEDAWDEAGKRPEYGGEVRLVPVGAPITFATGVPAGRERESVMGLITHHGRLVAEVGLDKDGVGRFDARGLPAGTYDLIVTVGQVSAQRRVHVADGATLTLAIEVPDGTTTGLTGWVRTGDGRPIDQGRVFATAAGKSRFHGDRTSVSEDGRFEFAWMPPGRYVVTAQVLVEGEMWIATGTPVDFSPGSSVEIALTPVSPAAAREAAKAAEPDMGSPF